MATDNIYPIGPQASGGDAGKPTRAATRMSELIRPGQIPFADVGNLTAEFLATIAGTGAFGLTLLPVVGSPAAFWVLRAADAGGGAPGYLGIDNDVVNIASMGYDESASPVGYKAMTCFIGTQAADNHATGYFPMRVYMTPNSDSVFKFEDAITARAFPLLEMAQGATAARAGAELVKMLSGGVVYSNNTDHASTITSPGFETLLTIPLPLEASSGLAKDGDYYILHAVFNTLGAATSLKQIQASIVDTGSGTCQIIDTPSFGSATTGQVVFNAKITRKSVSLARSSFIVNSNLAGYLSTGIAIAFGGSLDWTDTLSIDVVANLAGTGIATGDITLKECSVTLHRQGHS